MRYEARLRMGAGGGRLVRMPNKCLFVPEAADTAEHLLDELIEVFRNPNGSDTDIADFVLARTSATPAFVIVIWAGAASGRSRLHLIVRGDVTVITDLPSVPSLSGAGSSTWVEHHVPHRPDTAEISVGTDAAEFTDLTDGIVAANGFRLRLTANAAIDDEPVEFVEEPATQPGITAHREVEPNAISNDPSTAKPVAASDKPMPAEPPATRDRTARTTRPTEMRAESDSSLFSTSQKPPPTSPVVKTPAAKPEAVVPAAETPAASEEADAPERRPSIFVGNDPVDAAPPTDSTAALGRIAALNAASGDGARTERRPQPDINDDPSPVVVERTWADESNAVDTTEQPTPPRRPDFTGNRSAPDDAEVTLHPEDPFDLTDGTPLTDARLCPESHPNPPHLLRCRTCQRSLDPTLSTVTVEQPVLGLAQLDDGTVIELTGSTLFGRNPKLDAVESPIPDRLMRLEAPSSVSRSHVLIVAKGWTLTAIDCGSRAGTALLPADEPDPVPLEAWTPHELSGGDVLYLGGPTTITINEAPG